MVELGHIGLMLPIFLRSIWVATASRPNHTFYRKVYINEFVANALHDNIESKKIQLLTSEKRGLFLVLNINVVL